MNHPGTADLMVVLIVTRVIGKTEGASLSAEVTPTHCRDEPSVIVEEAPQTLFKLSE